MKFNPIQNIIHFIHYKLTSNLFKQTEIYYTSEFYSRIAVGTGLCGIILVILLWLHFNLAFNFTFISPIFEIFINKTSFALTFLFVAIIITFILFRPVKFKTFWKIHKSITKNEEYYKQLKRKFIFQLIGIVIIFFIIIALLKYYYQN
jgi:hypothetical protein